ncbi:hypothetical protein PV08_11470 [Exophiala spinifera]|uniref:BTB domain-containing protein n=1 Tax=Exophiala spinifera TaxID=91928 RepID=A0A0D1Y6M9_9EURO|nr:uncharacterized protein PV08_11470 [Exophiala spinifera]KIW10506.1 hypothetical protein PV08_11470 [Exophiala spinifera]
MAPQLMWERVITVDPDCDLVLRIGSQLRGNVGSEATGKQPATKASSGAAIQKKESSSNAASVGEKATKLVSKEVPKDTNLGQPGVLIRVASKTLVHYSPVFKAMLTGPFREGQLILRKDNPPILDLPEDEPNAMELLLRILHQGKTVTGDHYEERDGKDICGMARASDKYCCSAPAKLWFRNYLLYHHCKGAVLDFDECGRKILDEIEQDLDFGELAWRISASYLLKDPGSFYHLTKKAIKTIIWNAFPIPHANPRRPRFEAVLRRDFWPGLSGSDIQDIHDSLQDAFNSTVHELINLCLSFMDVILRRNGCTSHGDVRVRIDTEEFSTDIRPLCDGQTIMIAELTSELIACGLWPIPAQGPDALWSIFFRITTQRTTGSASQAAHHHSELDDPVGVETIAEDGDVVLKVGFDNETKLLRVSKESLMQRSDYFKALLSPRWGRSTTVFTESNPLVVEEENDFVFDLFMHIVHDKTLKDPGKVEAMSLTDLRNLALTVDRFMHRGEIPPYIGLNLAKYLEPDDEQTGTFSNSLLDCMIIARLLKQDGEFVRASKLLTWHVSPNTLPVQISDDLRRFLKPDFVKMFLGERRKVKRALLPALCEAWDSEEWKEWVLGQRRDFGQAMVILKMHTLQWIGEVQKKSVFWKYDAQKALVCSMEDLLEDWKAHMEYWFKYHSSHDETEMNDWATRLSERLPSTCTNCMLVH